MSKTTRALVAIVTTLLAMIGITLSTTPTESAASGRADTHVGLRYP